MMKTLAHSAAVLALAAPLAFAQTPVAAPTGSLHGHVNNAAGQSLGGEIRLTKDRTPDEKARHYLYTFPVDKDGNYKGTGIAPGNYVMFFFANGKSVDYIDPVNIKANEDVASNDDMTREEFMKNMSPEDRKMLEEFKAKNAAASAANKTVANLNALLTKSRDAQKAGNYDEAAATMTEATAQKPDEPILWIELGNAQLGAKKYDEAIVAYQKAVDVNASKPKPTPALAGSAYNNMGQAYAKLNKPKDAGEAYEKAAQAEPEKASSYYFNEAAQLYNANSNAASAAAADKAIAADPNKPDAYYIKGQALVGGSTVDPKSQKLIPPPGCLEAYSKYLQLAPTGSHAKEVQDIVAAFDDKVVSGYKNAPAKKK